MSTRPTTEYVEMSGTLHMLLLSVDSLGSPIMVRFSGAVSLIMWYACTGAIPVTEGHFNSLTLSLLPGNTQFVCDGSESTLSECRNTSQEHINVFDAEFVYVCVCLCVCVSGRQ